MPLVDENRALALLGLRRLAQTQKAGLRALMRVGGVDPAAIDESSIGFRLAPRINASGRLCRPEAALALLLTEDADEAKTLAEELESLNRERQAVEERISREAIDQIESWPEARRRRRGYVVAGEGWHEGVIGIVASRLVERYNRPVVIIAGTDGEWKGSGRSVPAFDLHARPRRVLGPPDALRRPPRRRGADDRGRARRDVRGGVRGARGRDALGGGPAARDAHRRDRSRREARARPLRGAAAARAVRHRQSRASCCSSTAARSPSRRPSATASTCASVCASAAATPARRSRSAWAASSTASGGEERYDVAFRLQENRWNGTVAPQLVVRRVFDAADGFEGLRDWLAGQWRAGEASWTPEARAIFGELELADGAKRSLLESATFRALLERGSRRSPRPLDRRSRPQREHERR